MPGVNVYFSFQIVKGAGHHVYADKAAAFNVLMVKFLDDIDNKVDNLLTTATEEEIPIQTETETEPVPVVTEI